MKNFNKFIFLVGALSLTSCKTITSMGSSNGSTIAHTQQVAKLQNQSREYHSCVSDGLMFDTKALTNKGNSQSLYKKSASILSKCDEILGDYNVTVNEELRMQNYALSIQNYLKSGNLRLASIKLDKFKDKFNKDLIYSDGSSFTENVDTVLDFSNEKNGLDIGIKNSNKKIKSELKRAWYWLKN